MTHDVWMNGSDRRLPRCFLRGMTLLGVCLVLVLASCGLDNGKPPAIAAPSDQIATISRGISTLNGFVADSMRQGDCEFLLTESGTVVVSRSIDDTKRLIGRQVVPVGLRVIMNKPVVEVKVGTRAIIAVIDSDSNVGGHMRYDP